MITNELISLILKKLEDLSEEYHPEDEKDFDLKKAYKKVDFAYHGGKARGRIELARAIMYLIKNGTS